MRNGFFKGHGLGNDYLVLDPAELEFRLTPRAVRRLGDRAARRAGRSGSAVDGAGPHFRAVRQALGRVLGG